MPIRVNGVNQPDTLITPTTPTHRSDLDFTQILAQTQRLQSKELEDFLKKLNAKGKQLSETFSLRDLSDFKDMIKTFLKSTFGQSRKMSEEAYWDYGGRTKYLSRVTKIDKALEELGKSMLDAQTKPLDILTKIDEIRGLIIDLLA